MHVRICRDRPPRHCAMTDGVWRDGRRKKKADFPRRESRPDFHARLTPERIQGCLRSEVNLTATWARHTRFGQKISFIPNCMIRGSRAEVMTPKVELLFRP